MKTLSEELYQLTEGPLPKSIYTYQLEAITRKLLMDQDFQFTKEGQQDFITIDKVTYNWTEIINYANMDHIELNRHDFYLYSMFIQSVSHEAFLDSDSEMLYKRELYSDYYLKNHALPDPVVSFQEMQAINIYTGGFYKQMNAVLRGEFDFKSNGKKIAKEAIIQSVMCLSGLRKIPETPISDAYRGAKMPSKEEHQARIQTAENHEVIKLAGFVSSSIDKKASFNHKPVHFHFTHLKGMYVGPISIHPDEQEFLIAPTQVQLTDYRFVNDVHCFEGRMVSDLAHVETHSLHMGIPNTSENIRLIEPDLSEITSYTKLRDTLHYLSPAHCKLVCEAKSNFILSAYNFANLMEFLSDEQRDAIYDVMMNDNKLIKMIDSDSDLVSVLMYLKPEQCTAVLDKMKHLLPNIISSADEFSNILMYLAPEQCKTVYEAMKLKLPSLIWSSINFNHVLAYLPLESRKAVYETMKLKLPNLIRFTTNFNQVMMFLPVEQRTEVYDHMKHKLQNMVHLAIDFSHVLRALTPEQCTTICDELKDSLPDIIESAMQFHDVLESLSPEQRTIVYEAMKNELPNIKSGVDFNFMLMYLTPEQRTTIYETQKNGLLNIIKTADDLSYVLNPLNPEQCHAVCNAIPNLIQIIQSTHDFNHVLNKLTTEQRKPVYDAMKDQLPNMIQSVTDLNNVLGSLTPVQCHTVCDGIKDRLHAIIPSSTDFSEMQHFLMPEQITAVYEAMEDRLPNMIQSANDLGNVLGTLTAEQAVAVCNTIKKRLPNIIRSTKDLSIVLLSLTQEQFTAVCPEIVQSASDLSNLQRSLTPEQFTAVLNTMKYRLPNIIQSANNLEELVDSFTPQQRDVVYDAMKDRLDDMIQSVESLSIVLYYLPPKLVAEVYKDIEYKLPEIIKSASDLEEVLRYIPSTQSTALCEAMKERVFNLIEPDKATSMMLLHLSPESRQTVVSVKQIIDSLVTTASEEDVRAFASALMSHNPKKIKAQFDNLAENTPSPAELVATLADIEPSLIKKLSTAIGLELTDTQSKADINDRLKHYLTKKTDCKKSITQQYKLTIKPGIESVDAMKNKENIKPSNAP